MSSTKDRLIDSALLQLDEQGLDGLTLRSIARSAGVSHAAPVRHFTGLSSMLSAVAAHSFRELMATVSRSTEQAGTDPLLRLRAAGRGYIEFAIANPAAYALMFRPERLDPDDEGYLAASMASFAQLGGLAADAQAMGWRPDVGNLELTGVLWAGVHGIASLWIQGALQLATSFDVVDRLLDLHEDMLAGTPARDDRQPQPEQLEEHT